MEKEEFKADLQLINEMKTLFNQITELRIQLIFKEIDIRKLKQELNSLHGKQGVKKWLVHYFIN